MCETVKSFKNAQISNRMRKFSNFSLWTKLPIFKYQQVTTFVTLHFFMTAHLALDNQWAMGKKTWVIILISWLLTNLLGKKLS